MECVLVQKKKIKLEIVRKIQHWRNNDKKSWEQIKEELVQQQKDGIIPDMDYESKHPFYFSNWYGQWKNRLEQSESKM